MNSVGFRFAQHDGPFICWSARHISMLYRFVPPCKWGGATVPTGVNSRIQTSTNFKAWTGILQADAYGGYNELYASNRHPGPILEAGCFAHARRKFFELADVEGAARKKSRGEKAGIVYLCFGVQVVPT